MKHYPAYEWFLTPHWLRKFGPLRLVSATLLDRVGLHYFTLYASFNGAMQGVFSLAAVVLAKSFDASEIQLGLFNAMSAAFLLVGIIGAELVEGRDKRPFILTIGLISRGAFLAFLCCYTTWSFMTIAAVFFILNALLMPAVFSMWQSNISPDTRSHLWGLTVTITTVVSMSAAYSAGYLLDRHPDSFRWVFASAGLLGMMGVAVLSLSPLRGRYKLTRSPSPLSLQRLLIQPVTEFISLLAKDRRFAAFESVFFLYGLALMVLFPVIPLFIVNVAGMSYAQAGIAIGSLGQVGVIFLAPVWGKLMDRMGPVFLCVVIFSILVAFPLIMLGGLALSATQLYAVIAVYAGHLVLGIAMSGIHVAWSVGPVTFAGHRDASNYSGAHVTLTGIRGLIGPMTGALVLKYLGFAPVFVISASLFCIAALGMGWLQHRHGRLRASSSET